MRAAVFHGPRDIRVEDVADPGSPGAGELRVRPLWCGICGTDLHEFTQGPIVIPTRPHELTAACGSQILGHEFSAEILETGPGVTGLRPGQRVSIMPLLSCGECYHCRRGRRHLCRIMAAIGLSYAWGGLATEAIVPATNVALLPDEVTDLQGALIEPGAVAAYGVDTAGVRPGDTVLVTGAGPIGALAALYAESIGARVFVAEVNPIRAALVADLGVAEVLDPMRVDVAEVLRDATEGVGADAVIECSGNERALQSAIAAVRSSGRISQTGLHTGPASIDAMALSERDITLAGTWCFPTTDWPRIIDLVARGRYRVEKVVTATVPLDEVVSGGFEVLTSRTGDQVKVLVGSS